jgi:hypothetical protein
LKDIVQLSKEAVDTFLSKVYDMLFKETVTSEMWTLLHKLVNDEHLKDFVLVGGTALSLRIGHLLRLRKCDRLERNLAV